MEVVQRYMNNFHSSMRLLNNLEPDIEPRATGHIIEQQEIIRLLLEKGFAYEVNGSVYFDVEKYNKSYNYGILSGRILEDLRSNTRTLEGQQEKRSSFDFALWKKAAPEHIMQWPSPWSNGFPGWHLECSAMSMKYLGEPFDIHGGGMDLQFPHHDCEIAQSTALLGHSPVKYWMHNNMITINGQKMARSLNNFITLDQLFTGDHPVLEQAYSPMTVRFFILQAHYRSTLDFSNEALQAAEKGLARLMKAMETLKELKASAKEVTYGVTQAGKSVAGKAVADGVTPAGKTVAGKAAAEAAPSPFAGIAQKCYAALNDDLNTPVMISHLFDGVRIINSVKDGRISVTQEEIESVRELYNTMVYNILGLTETSVKEEGSDLSGQIIDAMLTIRHQAKERKDFETADRIRDALTKLGIVIKDRKDGADWERMA
jgi:cysteinyl-tRNA synthetase